LKISGYVLNYIAWEFPTRNATLHVSIFKSTKLKKSSSNWLNSGKHSQ